MSVFIQILIIEQKIKNKRGGNLVTLVLLEERKVKKCPKGKL